MNMKKVGQNCSCLRLSSSFLRNESERRDEIVDWANYKCSLLGPKLGNVPR